ncbi:DUF461 domain-containing protein [Streptomyces sp. NBC_01186]|uniref:DUF461 domain-containing protein n=1 Tax=Streptomyces sp. NBC_01186 TaxID=2903765 RepID=UPI002E0D3473|nr:DUF461 domain-containing protein [Streptomyces sp. NBC_01186]
MSSSLRRGTLAATALALSVATLTACGAGNDAQTLEIKPDNAATRVGTIKVQNANIVTNAQGSGQATVAVRIFNNGKKAQTLKGVAIKGQRAKLSPAKGERKLEIPAHGSLALGGKKNAAALFEDVESTGVADGNAQPLTFDLSSTGSVKLRALVVPAKHDYASVGPTAEPSQSPGASDNPSGSPSPSSSKGEKGRDQQGDGAEDKADGQDEAGQGANRQDDATGSPKATSGSSQQGARTGH